MPINYRLPIELNSTFRWTTISCVQLISNLAGETVTATTISLFFGFNMYVDACLNDVKSLFNRIDRLSKEIGSDQKMFAYCTEAIDLHGRITRYILIYMLIVVSDCCNVPIRNLFQLPTEIGWCDELDYNCHSYTQHFVLVLNTADDKQGAWVCSILKTMPAEIDRFKKHYIFSTREHRLCTIYKCPSWR